MSYKDSILRGAAAADALKAFDPKVRASYMNASEADSCIRKQWYMKNEADKGDEQSWGYARRGSWGELYMVKMLKLANVDLRYAGEDQLSIQCDDTMVSATPDGVIVDHDAKALIGVEFKTIDPRTNKANLPKGPHVTQLQLCMDLIDAYKDDFDLPDYPFSHGVIIYMNASDFDDITEHRVQYVEDRAGQLHQRAKRLLNSKSATRLPREGKVAGGRECTTMCAFKRLCGVDVAPEAVASPGEKGAMTTTLERAVGGYWDAKLDEDDASKRKAALAEIIKEQLRKQGLSEIETGGRKVQLQTVAGRTTFDKKAAEKAGLDLSPFEKVGAPSERLIVK
jgi:hypothetical protein